MFDNLLSGFSRRDLMPHGMCFLWDEGLLSLHLVSDSLIAASYYSIPFALAYFVLRRRDFLYRWVLILFAAFILACGTTHVFDVWTLWHPHYGVQGLLKAATAALSMATAVSLWLVMPRALKIPTPSELAVVNGKLSDEISRHRGAVERLESEASERRTAETALRASEERLDLALTGADLGLWDWNVKTGIAVFNERWATMLGYSLDEIRPQFDQWLGLIHPDDLPTVMDRLNAHLDGTAETYEVEHRLLMKGGRWRWVLTRGKVFDREPDGTPVRAAGTHMDITARKELEERLQQQQDELCYAQRLTTAGELVATMAHELNQPLGAIANYAGGATLRFRDLLEANPALGEVMANMLKLSTRAGEVVAGIRDLVRKHELQREWVDLEAIIREVLPLVHGELQRKRIRLRLNIQPGLPPVWGQSIYLQQLVLNLVLNAIDAMASHEARRRELRIWASSAAAQQVEVGISDSGPGFAQEIAQHLFEPFLTTKPDGIGLGLSICRTIVEAHGGRMTLQSSGEHGVTWNISLPIHRAETDHGV